MPSIGRRHYDAVTTAIQSGSRRVRLSKLWQDIHAEWGIGLKDGADLVLDLKEHEKLQALVQKATGLDARTQSGRFDSRLEAAEANAIDEKWGGGAGTARMVHVTRLGAPIWTHQGQCDLPKGAALWVDVESLAEEGLAQLVVVENLQAFLGLTRFQLPPEWREALFVYRGHDQGATGVIALLNRLPEAARVAVFSDYDPAGLRIALSTPKAEGWIGPAPGCDLGASNLDLYERQSTYLHGLLDGSPMGLRPVVTRMVNERVAFTQERMLTAGTPLSFHAFHPVKAR